MAMDIGSMIQPLIDDFLLAMTFPVLVFRPGIVIEVWHLIVLGVLAYILIHYINRLHIEY